MMYVPLLQPSDVLMRWKDQLFNSRQQHNPPQHQRQYQVGEREATLRQSKSLVLRKIQMSVFLRRKILTSWIYTQLISLLSSL